MKQGSCPPAPRTEWAYFLDFDGTLVEIAATPDAVSPDGALAHLLGRLADAASGAVALISGRTISSLEGLLGGVNLPLVGQHGLERRDTTGRVRTYASSTTAAIENIRKELRPVLTQYPRLLLEDKGATVALHYRAAPHLGKYVAGLMTLLAKTDLQVQHGKCVVEAKPFGFDKGTAIKEFLSEEPFAGRRPVFIGDDLTDEHGFAAVNEFGGVSIKVGEGGTCAQFRLPDVAAVRNWLQSL